MRDGEKEKKRKQEKEKKKKKKRTSAAQSFDVWERKITGRYVCVYMHIGKTNAVQEH